jgi:hypothetical protein
MGTENIHVSVENDKRLNLNVNIGQGDEIKVPVTIGGGGGGSCDIDTTELAKQGDDQKATNTAIFNAVNTFLSRSVKYDKTTGNLTIENVELIIE